MSFIKNVFREIFRRVPIIAIIIVILIIVSMVLAEVLSSGLFNRSPIFSRLTKASSNVIVLENAHQGTTDWKIPSQKLASIQIQAYANATSVLPKQKLTFYVSTIKAYTFYSIAIYRLGWYGGSGGRLVALERNLISQSQGYYDHASQSLKGCVSCLVDARTGKVEANWKPSFKLTIPSNWVTGLYLAKFTDINGMQTYVPFDVRGNFNSSYVAVTPDATYEAYNDWGGFSLYRAYDKTYLLTYGVKVSFNRPFDLGVRADQVIFYEADVIHWMERQGYDLSYISNIDLQEDPTQLLHHHAYLSLGHDEYWSKEMRDGVEQARDKGVGLAFFGANAAYWQIRLESDSVGDPNRTIVCYKVSTLYHDLKRDPFYGRDNTRVTALWRDPLINRPENALIGIMYSHNTQVRDGFPWQVNPQTKSLLLVGTGLQPGLLYGCDIVGNEWDRVFANDATPKDLQVLGVSQTVYDDNKHDVSHTTYYIASSGAMVFATGSIYWTFALDNYRFDTDRLCIGHDPVVPGIQELMSHVMDALIIHHKSPYL